MADESTELVKAAAEGGVQAFLATICGPLVEASDWGSDVVRRHRLKTQIKTLQLAQSMLEDAGLAPHVIPAKVLVPLLELSSLEEESVDPDGMHMRCAGPCVSASRSDRAVRLHQSAGHHLRDHFGSD